MPKIFLFGLILALSAQIEAQIRSVRDADPSRILKVEKSSPDLELTVEDRIGFPGKTTLVLNRAKTYKAYVACAIERGEDSICTDHVIFSIIKTDERFMIKGEVLGPTARPITDLKWLDNERLSYERWMNPHFGRRYVVNVRTRKQVGAWILSDGK